MAVVQFLFRSIETDQGDPRTPNRVRAASTQLFEKLSLKGRIKGK